VTSSSPARERVRFPGISPRAYEHPADRTALVALRRLAGFDTALRVLAGAFRERSLRLVHLASFVRVGPTQFPALHAVVQDGARVLDLDEVPEVYVRQSPEVGVWTLGIDSPWLVVSTGALDLFDAEELRFAVGHELGHVLSGHAVYRTLLHHLLALATRVAWVPIAGLGLRAVVFALEEWQRSSELSCDRAGLLVGQDIDAALRAHMKIAGGSRLADMDAVAFLEQAEAYESTGQMRDSVLKLLNLTGRSHPFAVQRAAELRAWVVDGHYSRVLDGDYPSRVDDASASWRDEAAETVRSYRAKADSSSDPLVRTLRDVASGAADISEDVLGRLRDRFGRRGEPGGGADPAGGAG
jgi:Zn-dependent protease with chaperone function